MGQAGEGGEAEPAQTRAAFSSSQDWPCAWYQTARRKLRGVAEPSRTQGPHKASTAELQDRQ